LEKEMQLLRDKLARKNKIIAELQRSIVHADETTRDAERKLNASVEESRKHSNDVQVAQNSLRVAENKILNQEKAMEQMQLCSRQRDLEQQKIIQDQSARILELEKANRTLNNEKAVLSAAVEARESKLAQMAELKASLATVSAKLSQQETIQQELVECEHRCSQITVDLERVQKQESNVRKELADARAQIDSLNLFLKEEAAKTTNHQLELEKEQMKVQKLKAERNSFKQKADSLAKEISRVCRNGRTMRDVEKIISDDFTRKQEVELLRKQKQNALDEAQTYRILMEQAQMTQKLMGKGIMTEYESMSMAKLSHRNTELERLVSELTEYITAKEMQLDTMKQINDALQAEMRSLAKASLSKNEV
jgi:chromosome segregation ATPase